MAARLTQLRATRIADARFTHPRDGQDLLAKLAGVNVQVIIDAERTQSPSPGVSGQAEVHPDIEKRLEVALGVGAGALR